MACIFISYTIYQVSYVHCYRFDLKRVKLNFNSFSNILTYFIIFSVPFYLLVIHDTINKDCF